ncbi:Indole-3-acetic acid inducible 33 [Theobroma cacao]|uniref:Auxin-responsive protein n=1 Tax=Theobroma cacao TaxID=3641 RepID=A0A061GQU1_THECC|nr:Indole-3-acetic acid inducible 33 [Theobroma cacao]
MNSFESQRQDSLKRRLQDRRFPNINTTGFVGAVAAAPIPSHHSSAPFLPNPNNGTKVQSFPGLDDDDLVSSVVPPVTVVLEGRSICQRISLHNHASYHSLAKALRQMFVEGNDDGPTSENELDLSNAVPGHLVAYEDMENDLLLAGDLNWKDFVRVAKRIRILPAKGNSRKIRGGA